MRIENFSAGSLKQFLMLMFCGIEHLSHSAVVQIDGFIYNCGRAFYGHGYQGCIAPLGFEFRQIRRRHLTALAGDLEQSVLMDLPFNANSQAKSLECSDPFDMFEHVSRVRLCW
jgi:hypothetical protein